tara:strand:- start:4004 stop:4915 length:912 start_codon:yes stop_codon:yes gene_type:complete
MNRYIPIAYHESYKLDLPKGHRFPMEKYKLLPNELINQGISKETDFFSPYPPELNCVTQVHDKDYVLKLKSLKLTKPEIRKIGFPLSKELIDREFLIAGGTVIGANKALTCKISMNIAGGTHHSFSDRGEGFCLLNDQAIAAKYLLKNHTINKILIIDLDVHQGNGTASIFKSNDQVFTFSMHGDKNFPFKKEKSDLDIGLKDNTTDIEYLTILKKTLPLLIKKVKPNFIFYLSGVDVIKTDKLGRLSLTLEGCKNRDKFVFSLCKKENIPVQCSMGGGYSEDISVIVDAHLNTYKMAKEVYF